MRIDVLRHGLDEATALEVESVAIDLYGLRSLTNVAGGANGNARGWSTTSELNARYGLQPAMFDIDERIMLVRIARAYRPGMTDEQLYDTTRRWWRVGAHRRQVGRAGAPAIAMAVYEGVVRAVYIVESWEPTASEDIAADPGGRAGRWVFNGRRDLDLERKYLHADVSGWFPRGSQSPIRYVNC